MDKKNKQKDKINTEAEEWKNKYLRALADYQNLEKRTQENTGEIRKRTAREIILKFIDVLDTIEKAEIFISDPGLKLIKDKFLALLGAEGIEEIDMLGQEYDPYIAECVQVVEGEKDNTVCEVLQKGYRQGETVIRPAQVKVTRVNQN
jgi:molecular chaperone GrpE